MVMGEEPAWGDVTVSGDEGREPVGMVMVKGEEGEGDKCEFLAPDVMVVREKAAVGFLPLFPSRLFLLSPNLPSHSHTPSPFFFLAASSPPTVTVSRPNSTSGVKRSEIAVAAAVVSLSGESEWKRVNKTSSGRGVSSSGGEEMVRV